MTFRQTAKTNLLQPVFRCLYSRAQIFVFAVNSLRKPAFLYFCVVYLRIRRKEKKKIRGNLYRLPSAVYVMLKLSIKLRLNRGNYFCNGEDAILHVVGFCHVCNCSL